MCSITDGEFVKLLMGAPADAFNTFIERLELVRQAEKEYNVQDRIEIGTPGRGGVIKVHGNFNRPEEFRIKIDHAKSLIE